VKREENINIHNRVRQQRAQNIFANPIDLNEDYQTPRYPKSDAAVQFIDSALEDNFIFASLSSKERRLLIDAMMLETVPAGTVIIKQGESKQSSRISRSLFLSQFPSRQVSPIPLTWHATTRAAQLVISSM
jgi:hypothetical protein